MTITKNQMARDLVNKTGYYLKDVKYLLSAMDDLIKEYFAMVTDDEEVMVQMVAGIKCGCFIVPERSRRNPKTQEDVVCCATCKPKTKYSQDFRKLIQKNYEEKKNV